MFNSITSMLLSTSLVAFSLYGGVYAAKPLPSGTLAMPLRRIVNQTSYGIEMSVGTPPQVMTVLIDTGSSMIGLQGMKSNWCKLPYKPCQKYGSYNNLTSSTAVYKDDNFSNQLINHGFGSHISDTVQVGGQTFEKLTVGMITDYAASFPAPKPNSGLIGLVPICLNKKCTKTAGTTLQEKLINRGFLKKNVLSVYLGPDDKSAVGSLLFGAIDRAKQKGKAVTIPVIDPTSSIANLSPNLLNFSSISVETNSKSPGTFVTKKKAVEQFKIAKGSYTLLDTGFPLFSLPTEAWHFVKKYFGIKGQGSGDSFSGVYKVDCKFRSQQADDATLLVGFKDDELQIRIPFSRFVTQRADGNCVTGVTNCGTNGRGCSWGDPFFRSVYAVFDLEGFTITLSNVRYTSATDIVAA